MSEQKLLSVAMEQVTWRLQVSVVKSPMKLSASFEIRFLILILRAHSKWTNGMPNVTACVGVQFAGRFGSVLAVRGKVEGQLHLSVAGQQISGLPCLLFSFHPK